MKKILDYSNLEIQQNPFIKKSWVTGTFFLSACVWQALLWNPSMRFIFGIILDNAIFEITALIFLISLTVFVIQYKNIVRRNFSVFSIHLQAIIAGVLPGFFVFVVILALTILGQKAHSGG